MSNDVRFSSNEPARKSWTIRDEAVTCPKCLAIMGER
jgi:hypothetical protein